MTAMRMRRRYMNVSRQPFHKTTDRYLCLIDSGVDTNDHHEIDSQFTMQTNDSLSGNSLICINISINYIIILTFIIPDVLKECLYFYAMQAKKAAIIG